MSLDLWDVGTYDADIEDWLHRHKSLILGYFDFEKKRDEEMEKEARWSASPPNPYSADYLRAREDLAGILASKEIRVFHYSRMTDREVKSLVSNGIVPTSSSFLKERIDHIVEEGLLSKEQGGRIFAESPLHFADSGIRKGFWTTTVPFQPSDGAVNLLVGFWGGESAYWRFTGARDEGMLDVLRGIGRGRILEILVPLLNANSGRAAFSVGEVVIKQYAQSLGCELWPEGRDICVDHTIPGSKVLRVHSEGEKTYSQFGKTYPESYSPPNA
ncbi:hypothetical protein [Mesorhizobium sp. CN2-181]|uniref:hypothetical protein n=1 Tax=Mesorhizobium yinganensis TaxID=3157707 RepID=UPI0032B7411A